MSHEDTSPTIAPPKLQLEPKHASTSPGSTGVDEELVLPQLHHQSDTTRRSIIAAYWIVVALCLPIWWNLTSIERLSLPKTRIERLNREGNKIKFGIDIILDPSAITGVSAPDSELNRNLAWRVDRELLECSSRNHEAWEGIDVKVHLFNAPASNRDAYEVKVVPSQSREPHAVHGRQIVFHTLLTEKQTFPLPLATTLCHLLVPKAGKQPDQKVVQYAPRYRLAFTLLNEDISAGGAPRGWAADVSVEKYIMPTLRQLGGLHNFTIESQVQYHGSLAFEPPRASRPDGSKYYTLGSDELKMFVNSADWSLSSAVTNDPVIHLVLFVPTPAHRPLHIVNKKGDPISSPTFIIPQWGGIVIVNPPANPKQAKDALTGSQIFSLFEHIITTVLGVPSLPKGVEHDSLDLSLWSVDALMRARAKENAKDSVEALASIVRLVEKIENMPVRKDVRDGVLSALEELETVYHARSISSLAALEHSQRALELSSKAFFDPGMVGMLYFPAEHKYAIYMLFVPASLPLVLMLIREIKDIRKARKARVGPKAKTE